jgi:hypothetical protein
MLSKCYLYASLLLTSGLANAEQFTTDYQAAPSSIVWKGKTHCCSTAYKEIPGYSDYHVGFRLNVPHYSQPTSNTCGATVLSMINSFEKLMYSGTLPPQPDILELYNTGNTDGASGLSTPELKALIVALGIYDGKFEEVGSSDIDTAIKDSFWSYSPLVIYGNTYFGSAGGHYYATTGAIYCDDTLKNYNQCSYRGLYLNDSVFDSPA